MIKGKDMYFNFYIQDQNKIIYSDNFEKILLLLQDLLILNNNRICFGIYYEHKDVDDNRIKGHYPLIEFDHSHQKLLDHSYQIDLLKQNEYLINQTIKTIQTYFSYISQS